ncbi:MAG TPA: amino-acid N-acetyltransferase [Spirochaetia bacterium]|nr:amino-acid N-acetyltransferase [Spirochaetia bacterium]
MQGQSLPAQVDEIRQVFAYVERFKGGLFVIKIDYSIISHPLFSSLINDIASLHRMGVRVAIVAGARQRIDEILETEGIVTRRVRHVRISSPEAMPLIKMAAFDVATLIMTQLSAANCSAVIGNWVRARSMGVVDGVDYLNTGRVEKVNDKLIKEVLDEGLVPIFPCIGWSAVGEPYNLSSDELASLLGTSLAADKVFYVIDSAGIDISGYRLPPGFDRETGGRISRLRLDQARELLDYNSERSDAVWHDVLSHALAACRGGVKRVHIVDGREEGVVLKEVFTNLGSGTMIYANEYESIRPMRHEDIPAVLRIMQPLIRTGILVDRDYRSLEHSLGDYVVYEIDGIVHGCGSLCEQGDGIGEIAGIAVEENFLQLGIGKRIVTYLMELGREKKLKRLFLLTTRTSDWFMQLGFRQAGVEGLPERRRAQYDRSRNSRVLVYDIASRE